MTEFVLHQGEPPVPPGPFQAPGDSPDRRAGETAAGRSAPSRPLESIPDQTRKLVAILEAWTNRLPRDRKFTLGDRVLGRGIDLLETVVEAWYTPAADRAPKLRQANLHLEVLRQLLRLGLESQVHDLRKHEHLSREIDGLGRMLGAWGKKTRASV